MWRDGVFCQLVVSTCLYARRKKASVTGITGLRQNTALWRPVFFDNERAGWIYAYLKIIMTGEYSFGCFSLD
jgi:hypothetical protein